jgi:hypothetical protein
MLDPGLKVLTSHGSVGTSDSAGNQYPLRIFDVSLVATGTAGVATLYIGKAASGSKTLQIRALADSQNTWSSCAGLLFTSGCYVDCQTAGNAVTVSYYQLPI